MNRFNRSCKDVPSKVKLLMRTMKPLIGVSVIIKGASTIGTITDFDGNYALEVPAGKNVLEISYIGYKTQEITIGKNTQLNIKMQPDTQTLDEVVVIGYGTVKKRDLTGAVASVKSEDIVRMPTSNVLEAIQGQVAGLDITRSSGEAGSGVNMTLRGTRSINGDNSPLFIIDGMEGSYDELNPNDIASIEVLKDASSTAVYGAAGANGVIIITTKRANESNFNKVEYNAYVYTQTIASKMDMLTASDYRQQIADGFRDTSWDKGQDTDWLDQITRTPISHVHNLSFTGGNRTTNYLLNVNFRQAQGIFKKSDNQRLNVRAKVNHKMFDDKLTASFEILNTQKQVFNHR